jgi:catechol-2,3-dioxygenase
LAYTLENGIKFMIISFSILLPIEFEQFNDMIKFYSLLGFEIIEQGVSSLENPWCQFQVSGITLTIHTGKYGKFPYPEFRPSGHGIALSIQVENLQNMIRHINEHGIEPLNRWTNEDGTEAISISDPGGNILELWA